MNEFILTTSAGLESLAKKEIQKQGGEIIETTDRLIIFKGDLKTAAKINIWSRVGNKVYMLLKQQDNITNFDDLYSLVNSINFKKLIEKNFPIIVKATSIRSKLHHTPSLQSITKKAIIKKIAGEKKFFEDSNLTNFEILVLMINDKARILLNLSGEALHKRGYRTQASEAPIKENLAAGLVLLSNWRFKENFYDLFCGSGTIAIEAAMIARNIAPGLKRNFSIVDLGLISKKEMQELKEEARKKIFNSKYNIFASDIDEEVLEIARKNAFNAQVLDTIKFEKKDFRDFLNKNLSGTLVINPPYGLRLETNLEKLYKDIDFIFRKNPELKGGFISNYLDFDSKINKKKNIYKKRKLYNGAELCYFWKKL